MNFTWIPLYEEAATKLATFEACQADLLRVLNTAKAENIPVIALEDEDNAGKIKLSAMAPFTLFATFNRGTTQQRQGF